MINKIARTVLGLIFVVLGLNGFFSLELIPIPDFHPFMQILVETKYIYVVTFLEVLSGLMLLANHFVPLGLTILGPICVNIVLYHLLIDPRMPYAGYISFVLWVYLVYTHRRHFKPLLVKDVD